MNTEEKYIQLLNKYGIALNAPQSAELSNIQDESQKTLFLIDLLLKEKARRHFSYTLNLKSITLKCVQEELRIKKSFELLNLLTRCNVESFADLLNLTFAQILDILTKHNILAEFFSIVLTYDRVLSPDFNQLRNSDAINILEDFFFLNPAVMQLLNPTASAQDSPATSSILQTFASNLPGGSQNI